MSPSHSASHPAAQSIAALSELRECIAAWTSEPDLSRVLIAQVNHAEKLITDGMYDNARGAIHVIQIGMIAAGPSVWGAGV